MGEFAKVDIMRMSAADAADWVRGGGRVNVLKDGHAEVWDEGDRHIGFLTKASVELYLRLYGRRYGRRNT